ncbi:hypothetical protein [Peribacillus loiseleuriae]|uniref:HEAT repeat domain-containing protein n=1 Tax=Peribacillus loiseleuriae TaxID=1679170 RepID=A0A0K9GXT7_9BACI|nr:hypothetical protein [Peribacillus loiseleuriae]KMY51450.1 hypothetical protein AC625_19465 [Peribacillus loiseleuriae]
MDRDIQAYFENLEAKDKDVQFEAFNTILAATNEEVDWAYEVWDQLKDWLTDPDNHRRSRAAQFLSGLAISDPEKRMLNDFSALWAVTKDPKFVTARHSLQSIWKVGLAGQEQKEMMMQYIVDRFQNGANEKHYTLIRYDMIVGLKKLYDQVNDEQIKQTAMELIETEEDSKYRKKYLSVWK